MNLQQRVQAVGLVAGPVLALLVYWALPGDYVDAADKVVPLGHATLTYFLIGPVLLGKG